MSSTADLPAIRLKRTQTRSLQPFLYGRSPAPYSTWRCVHVHRPAQSRPQRRNGTPLAATPCCQPLQVSNTQLHALPTHAHRIFLQVLLRPQTPFTRASSQTRKSGAASSMWSLAAVGFVVIYLLNCNWVATRWQ